MAEVKGTPKRRYQLIIIDKNGEIHYIPLKKLDGTYERDNRSFLSNIDLFTTSFSDEQELIAECKRQGMTGIEGGHVSILYKQNKADHKLEVAYKNAQILENYAVRDQSQVEKSQCLKEFFGAFMKDIKNGKYFRFLIDAKNHYIGMGPNSLGQAIYYYLDLQTNYRRFRDYTPEDQRGYEKGTREASDAIYKHFQESYKIVRGIILGTIKYREYYGMNDLNLEKLISAFEMALVEEDYDDRYEDPDRNPYFIFDPFMRNVDDMDCVPVFSPLNEGGRQRVYRQEG